MLDRIRSEQRGDAGSAKRVLQGIDRVDGVGEGHGRCAGGRPGAGWHGQAGRVGCRDVFDGVLGQSAHRFVNGGFSGE